MRFSPTRMLEIQYVLEFRIRQMPESVRVTKRARMAGVVSDTALKALSHAWKEGEIQGLSFSTEKEQFSRAYEDVTSCMHGKGDFVHAAYTRTGKVAIATLSDDTGRVTARALYRMDTGEFFKVYGADHWMLEGILIALGLSCTQSWVKDIAHDIYVEKKECIGVEEYYRPEKRFPAPGIIRRFVREKEMVEYVAFASTMYNSVEVCADLRMVTVRGPDLVLSAQYVKVPIFGTRKERPYIDGDGI